MIDKVINKIGHKLPKSLIKEKLKNKYNFFKQKALIDQLSKVAIVSSGCDVLHNAEIPFVILMVQNCMANCQINKKG